MCIFYSCDIYTKFLLLFDKEKNKKEKSNEEKIKESNEERKNKQKN